MTCKGSPPPSTRREIFLAQAAGHLLSAHEVAGADPTGAYTLLYDAARKSLAAVLQAQGLRATSKGGHYAIQEAITAQFSKPPPRSAFHPFGRLRRMRNQVEYEDIALVTEEDIEAELPVVQALHAMAEQLIRAMPVFVA